MKALRNYLNKIKPTFEEGGRLSMFRSVFEGFETFLFVPSDTSQSGVHIHDSIDSKRTMTVVVIALIPALLFGMYNVGYQHNLAIGAAQLFWPTFFFGFLAVLPKIIVSYVVGLGIEFAVAQWKKEEIQEGFLVSGMLIPMIVPVDTPLWMIALATAFAVVFAKEVFGGTGYNIFNVALVTRAFLFFAYPASLSGESVWNVVDGYAGATALSQAASSGVGALAQNGLSWTDAFLGFMPGSIGETSTLAILLGGSVLLLARIAAWRIVAGVMIGMVALSTLFNLFAAGSTNPMLAMPWYWHLVLGGFAFGMMFMATDPVSASMTNAGKWAFGIVIGVMVVMIRVINPAYPEGMMLAILFGNLCAPLIDYFVIQANIKRRAKRRV